MNLFLVYTWTSILIGVLQIWEGYTLHATQGEVGKLVLTFSVFELIWAAVSVYVVYSLYEPPITVLWYPIIFVVYVLVGFFWSISLFGDRKPDDETIPVLPLSAIWAGTVFGTIFAFTGIYIALTIN
ncbi:MAG: hypothetical protein RIC89_12675 [Pseudomonadales bacterium]